MGAGGLEKGNFDSLDGIVKDVFVPGGVHGFEKAGHSLFDALNDEADVMQTLEVA